MVKRTHIVIAESSAIIRCGLTTLLHQDTSLNINIAEISNVSTLLTVIFKQTPDVLIINPSNLGLFSLTQLKSNIGNDNLKIVALQNSLSEQSTLQNYDEVISIHDGAETIIEKIKSLSKKDSTTALTKELSAREKEIITHVVKGLTNKQIADELFLSTHTVIAHRRNIANKLQIHSPSGLTIYAIVNKLVNLADVKNSITQTKERK